jgi:hypothetical protein
VEYDSVLNIIGCGFSVGTMEVYEMVTFPELTLKFPHIRYVNMTKGRGNRGGIRVHRRKDNMKANPSPRICILWLK